MTKIQSKAQRAMSYLRSLLRHGGEDDGFLKADFLPHLGDERAANNKALFILDCVRKTIEAALRDRPNCVFNGKLKGRTCLGRF